MNAVVETITPQQAENYLSTSNGNRPISKGSIDRYANEMTAGRWMLNGAPIIFDCEGHLIDGHHRLKAIVQSKVTVQILVVRGALKESFSTFDCGRRRSFGQLLAIRGTKNYCIVASVVLTNETLKKYGRLYISSRGGSSYVLSNSELEGIYETDPEGFNDAGEFARAMDATVSVLRPSWVGALYYYLINTGGYSKEYVRNFFENLCSLNESQYRGIELLRKRFIKLKMDKMKIDVSLEFALVAKAWNYYVDGNNNVKELSYFMGRETYPKLKLNTQS